MPLSHELVYGEKKLAWGSAVMHVPGAPSVSDLKGDQPPKKAGKTVSSTGVAGKSGEPYPEDFVYGKPKLAWDSGNRTKMVKPLVEEKTPVGTVGTVTPTNPPPTKSWVEGGAWAAGQLAKQPVGFTKRAAPAQMYGAQRTNERYNPDFGDNTYDRREELSASKGVVVPTSKEQSEWYYEDNSQQASDQFEPYFGDNTYARRAQLSKTRAGDPKMYGVERSNKRYNPDFGDNTYDRREELSTTKSSKGAVVPTSKEQSEWYYE